MSVTRIGIDDDALDEAMRMSGIATVTTVLREDVAMIRRIEALERPATSRSV